MKKFTDFSWLSSLRNFRLNLCFFLLPVCVEIQSLLWVWFHIRHRENVYSSTMPTRCVAAACSNTHSHGVSFFRFSRDPCLKAKLAKQVRHSRTQWNPRTILFLVASISKKTVLSLEQMLELDAKYDWQVTLPNTHRSLFPFIHSCGNKCS